ncbi:MAG: DUF4252 domain-containing protein [Bryobacteraceae bacterium]
MYKQILAACLMALPVLGQGPRLQINLDHLKAKAEETVNVNLDGAMLVQGLQVIEKGIAAGAGLGDLKGVYVRSFQFAKPGEYTQSDVEAIRKQMSGPNWMTFVEVNKKDGESVYISAYVDQGKQVGLAVLAAEPKELTVVNIVGPIDFAKMGALSSMIPELKKLNPAEQKKELKKREDE